MWVLIFFENGDVIMVSWYFEYFFNKIIYMDFDRYLFDEFINNCMNLILCGDEVSLNFGIIMVLVLNFICYGFCFGDVGLKNC